MRRLNVQFAQINECISTSLFAVDTLPRNPPLQQDEPLLLQLTKADAATHGRLDRRVEFALLFERAIPDATGALSLEHWPQAGKTWRFILQCSETIPTIPFSLEKIGLSRDYGGQMNPQYIEPADEAKIRPYLQGAVAAANFVRPMSVDDLLGAIRNYDTVVRLAPVRTSRVQEHQRRLRDPWLGDTLKILYDHRCQICVHDFKPRYGIPYADTSFLRPLEQGGEPVSKNLLVLCPNHAAIVGAARPQFDPAALAFVYANGLVEKLLLRDHLIVG
jgi:hypothetical protein